MTMFSGVTADTDPLAQTSFAGPPRLEAAQADAPRSRSRAAAGRHLITEHTGAAPRSGARSLGCIESNSRVFTPKGPRSSGPAWAGAG